jgi:alpha-amylase/alpha-mannosidase (GH57 family)
MQRFICIHGHFYQPPRENPWTDQIEDQPSASPYRNWNERITAECYESNAASHILDEHQRLKEIVNNYSKISFNFGPTLLTWMERSAPLIYARLLQADRDSVKQFSGHGSAIAQAYNHMIMPLANAHDKETQIVWGIKDFEYRFQRFPEGMWLPETAVDITTLECLASHGIKFTLLAPYQAKQIRPIGSKKWETVNPETFNTMKSYVCHLPSGKTITLFFYNGKISHQIAFGDLLKNGENFAKRLVHEFYSGSAMGGLVHVATDGETYGHHHFFGNMALSYCLRFIEKNHLAHLTNYGEYLEKCPPVDEVEIHENTSWSCSHGIERWRSSCGCGSLDGSNKTQMWRKGLREALDWLRDQLIVIYEIEWPVVLGEPWKIRNEYISIILKMSHENVIGLLGNMLDAKKALALLEMQRYAMLMYTSCGWFFEDVSRIETIKILQYAARALELAKEITGRDLEPAFLDRLEEAKSNYEDLGDGKKIYEMFVKSGLIR